MQIFMHATQHRCSHMEVLRRSLRILSHATRSRLLPQCVITQSLYRGSGLEDLTDIRGLETSDQTNPAGVPDFRIDIVPAKNFRSDGLWRCRRTMSQRSSLDIPYCNSSLLLTAVAPEELLRTQLDVQVALRVCSTHHRSANCRRFSSHSHESRQ
jgi:hypothetical protein